MSVSRACGVLAMLTFVAIAVVHLRAEQARCAAAILGVGAKRVELRRSLWELQARSARLRTPQRIHDRLDADPSELVSPLARVVGPRSATLVADRRAR